MVYPARDRLLDPAALERIDAVSEQMHHFMRGGSLESQIRESVVEKHETAVRVGALHGNGVYRARQASDSVEILHEDLDQRIAEHNAGTGAKYTRGRRPVELAYWETYTTKGDALRREAVVKKKTRKEKEHLIYMVIVDGRLKAD